MVGNYTFTRDSFLNGFNVGGAVRWQDKVNIGYPSSLVNGAVVYDSSNPFYGPSETNLDVFVGYRRKISDDRIDWRIQLNARNAYNFGDDLIVVRNQYNGTPAVYRLAPERRYSLTSSFSF